LHLDEELHDLRQRMTASGQYVTYSPGTNVEDELRHWLAIAPGADAAARVRAGWTRLAKTR